MTFLAVTAEAHALGFRLPVRVSAALMHDARSDGLEAVLRDIKAQAKAKPLRRFSGAVDIHGGRLAYTAAMVRLGFEPHLLICKADEVFLLDLAQRLAASS